MEKKIDTVKLNDFIWTIEHAQASASLYVDGKEMMPIVRHFRIHGDDFVVAYDSKDDNVLPGCLFSHSSRISLKINAIEEY